MKNLINLITTAVLAFLISACSNNIDDKSNLQYVDPNIGAVGYLLHPMRPNVQLPNQSIRMHPYRKDYLDDQIAFFTLSMVAHREGELFGVLPGILKDENDIWSVKQTYDHDLEILKPNYYSTYFVNSKIKTEFVPGKKSGFFKFYFPSEGIKKLKFNVTHDGSWEQGEDNSIIGIEEFGGMKAYVFGQFNTKANIEFDKEIIVNKRRNTSREQANAWVSFPENKNNVIEFKYAISYISIEQAQKNLNTEIPQWGFNNLKKQAITIWNNSLGQITVKGGTENQRSVFYTSLYRYYERMVNISEDGKYYSAFDHTVHTDSLDFYTDDWVWDTYLAQHPLRAILSPDLEADMLQSYVRMYEEGGWMPQFPILYKDKAAMHGFHSTIIFLDAYRKGIRNFDVEKAYEGMRKNATDATMIPWVNGGLTELDLFYRKNGYYPSLRPDEKETVKEVHWFEKRQSVAITLAHSYDDWALAEMAKELDKTDDYTYYSKESKNYRNLYNPEKKLMWPKDSEGNWLDIDPKFDGGPGGRDYYDENNGYTYAWQVQHDIPDLISLMGGNKKFIENLDQLFREGLGRTKYQFFAKFADATGLVGQFSMGNEPSFHIPYLYNYAGAAWKT
ncbi:MAG: glycoside hydrolase family 92 protein, partial [Bacteroidetes bacterium]